MNFPTLAPSLGLNEVSEVSRTRSAHRTVVEEHSVLVRKVARRVFGRLPAHVRGFEEDDLVSVGTIGLLDAWNRYEPQDGVAFEAFAEFRIKGAILDEIRRHDFFPRRLRAKANALRKAEAALTSELGRTPTADETAEAMGLSSDELLALRAKVTPYRFVADDDECVTLRSSVADPARVAMDKEIRDLLVEALKALPEREQMLLDLYFNKELKLREIADILEVSEGRVCQIKSEAIGRLRKRLNAQGMSAN